MSAPGGFTLGYGFAVGGGAGASRRRTINVAFLGDSVTEAISVETYGSDGYPNVSYKYGGYGNWLFMLTGGRVMFDYEDNFGVSGDRSDQILTRAEACAARPVEVMLIHAGHNDITQLGPFYGNDVNLLRSTLLDNIAAMVAAARDAGVRPVISAIWGHRNWASSFQTEAYDGHMLDIRAWCLANSVKFIDEHLPEIVDPETNCISEAMSADGVHPNALGAYVFAKPIARWLTGLLQSPSHCDRVTGDRTADYLNPLDGTGGTVSSPYTGQLADDLISLGGATITQGTVTFSKHARPEGGWEQRMTWAGVIGTNPAGEAFHGFRVRLETPDVDPYEKFMAVCRARFTSESSGLWCPSIQIYEYNGNGSAGPRTGRLRAGSEWPAELNGAEVTLRSPPMVMRPGTNGDVEIRIGGLVLETAGITGELAVWDLELLRVPGPPPPEPPDPIDVPWNLDADYDGTGSAAVEWTIQNDYGAATYDLVATTRIPGAYTLT